MAKSKSNDLKLMGNENSYNKDFFNDLYGSTKLTDRNKRANLKRSIILAAQKYMSYYGEYQRQLAAHEIERELEKVSSYIGKAQSSLWKVIMSGNYGETIVNNLYDIISQNHPPLQGLLKEIRREGPFISGTSPARSLVLLSSMEEAIDRTIKNFPSKKGTPRSDALYYWIMVLSAELEPVLGRKLEQSHYYKEGKKGEYISKKEMSDSELLLFIISPLDPNVTISQIETAIKETRKERHNTPWDNYFP